MKKQKINLVVDDLNDKIDTLALEEQLYNIMKFEIPQEMNYEELKALLMNKMITSFEGYQTYQEVFDKFISISTYLAMQNFVLIYELEKLNGNVRE